MAESMKIKGRHIRAVSPGNADGNGRGRHHAAVGSVARVVLCVVLALLSGQIIAYANQVACEASLDVTPTVTRDGIRYGVVLLVFFEIMYQVYRLWGSRMVRRRTCAVAHSAVMHPRSDSGSEDGSGERTAETDANAAEKSSSASSASGVSSPARFTGRWWSVLRTFLGGLFLLLAWAPYIYWYFPGSLWYDTDSQVLQSYGFQTLDSTGPYITTHHPLFDTLLFGWFTRLGSVLFDSKASGLTLLIGIQVVVGAFELSYVVEWFRSHGVGRIVRVLLLLFFAFFPFFPCFYCTLVKDSVHVLFLVPWLVMYLDVVLTRGASVSRPWPAVLFGLLSVGNALTTATGMYITALSLLVAIFFVSGRVRKICFAAAGVVLAVFCQLVFPATVPTPYPVQKSDAHQMFILPMQLTARYSSQFHDDVTPEEREAIDGFNMVSYDDMPQAYNPYLADPVIHLELNDPSYRNQYIRAWVSMGMRHPEGYLQAFLCMESGWFATRRSAEPDTGRYMSDTWRRIDSAVESGSAEYSYDHQVPTYMLFTVTAGYPSHLPKDIPDFKIEQVADAESITGAIKKFEDLPVVNVLMVQATWTFILPMMMLYVAVRGRKFAAMFWLFVPMLLTLLSLAPSGLSLPLKPTGSRYMYMLIIIVPIMMMLMLRAFAQSPADVEAGGADVGRLDAAEDGGAAVVVAAADPVPTETDEAMGNAVAGVYGATRGEVVDGGAAVGIGPGPGPSAAFADGVAGLPTDSPDWRRNG